MRIAALAASLLLACCSVASCSITGKQTTQALQSLPSGTYRLEKPHASLLFRVKHMGLSYYTARMTDFDATLDFDPKNPAASHVTAIINPLSVRAEHPTDQDWDRRIGEDFFEGKEFPQIVFDSKTIEVTGDFAGKVTGDLTFMGVTEPVTLDVTFNGSAPAAALYQGRDAVGFSARGSLLRSDFGLTRYGSIVGDEVEIVIEAEFTRRG